MRIQFRTRGDFLNTEKFLKNILSQSYRKVLKKYAEMGVQSLSYNTPVETGLTASSWSYIIEEKKDHISIVWTNNNINEHVNIALILQYGHATRNGGWIEGIDYINPSLQPIFKKIAHDAWKEVVNQ